MPSRLRLHSALFTVALLFSVNYIISKLGMRQFSPLTFVWLRVAGSTLVLLFVARNEEPLTREDGRRVAVYAILAVVINQALFLSGLSLTSVQVAALLITTIPVFAVGAAILAGRERATSSRIGGIALASVGALLVVGGASYTGTWRSGAGAMMIILNCLSYALYLVISKPAMARLSARAVVKRMFLVSTPMLLPICAVSLAREEWREISAGAWLALLLVIAGPTVAAYLLNAWALRHADSSVVAAYIYVQPILATILGAIFFGERIGTIAVIAGLMIFGGVWLAARTEAMTAEC